MELIDEYGKDWIKISDELGMNNPVKVKNRYYNLSRKAATIHSEN